MGSRAANGVLMVTTKRGKEFKREVNASVYYGMQKPTRYPEFLGSYDYARLYNEARENDGLSPYYSEQDLDGYQNSSGPNDLRYPNVDYYDYFLRDYSTIQKATAQFAGGNELVRYNAIVGYTGNDGLQEYGLRPRNDRFNVRGNVDLAITDAISANMGMGTIIDNWKRGGLHHGATFSALNSHRPNEYPLILNHPDLPEDEEGDLYYGGSYDHPANVLMELDRGGNLTDEYIDAQMNFGMDFDLDFLTEGLSANWFVTFDNYFRGEKMLNKREPTYAQRWVGQDSVVFDKVLTRIVNNNYSLNEKETTRNQGVNAKINYDQGWGNHALDVDLGFFYYKQEVPDNGQVSQDIKNTNTFLRTHYGFDNKYLAELTLGLQGSNRFDEDNQMFLSNAAGVSWILSEESFLETAGSLDFLKLKASYGLLGYDATTPYLLYNKAWRNAGNVSFGERNNGVQPERVVLERLASADLDWEKSEELNIGVEGLAFDQRLSFEFNYFNENRRDIIQRVNSQYSSVYASTVPFMNWGEFENTGFEGEMHWENVAGDLEYRIGGNFVWAENKAVQLDEINFPDEYRRTEGLPSDAIMGYESLGLFGKDVALDDHPHQTFGDYQEGDIAYRDLNNDGEINDLDRKQIGNSFPRITYGIDLELNYRGFGLYMLATGASQFDMTLQNAYSTNYGIGKYSTLAMERYHAENNPSGTQPRLTTTNASNNMVGSDFWLFNQSFLRLKNVELSYTFDNLQGGVAQQVKLFTRGSNLWVLSDSDALDPEAPNGGVNNYPVMATILGGVSVSF